MALNWRALLAQRSAPDLGWAVAALAAIACAGPSLAVMWIAAFGAEPATAGSSSGRLMWESLSGLIVLLAAGGGGATIIGVGLAWLVATCRFPGRVQFEWLLALPLAAPAYVIAYAYGGLLGPTGPIPLGIGGNAGAAFVYALCFYPYAYLAARAAFATQSVCALEAARSLGAGPWRSFARVALPMARPGIVAGLALAGMEIGAEYGAAAYFGAQTLTTGVFRAWFSMGAPQLAMQLASILLVGAGLLLWLERNARGARAFAGGSNRWRPLPRFTLSPRAAAGATGACALVLTLALVAPLGWLVRLAIMNGFEGVVALVGPIANSLLLATVGAGLTLLLATPIAAVAHGARTPIARTATLFAGMGYSAPCAVVALGTLAVFAALREAGVVAGLAGAAAFAALLWTYAARFAAAGAQPVEAGLSRVTPSMSGAAATLGAGRLRRFVRIEAPLALPSVLAAALVVFSEILRELPATLILRPFDFDTLAVRAHAYAADDRLAQAAAPALAITLAGLAPVYLLARAIARARPGREEP